MIHRPCCLSESQSECREFLVRDTSTSKSTSFPSQDEPCRREEKLWASIRSARKCLTYDSCVRFAMWRLNSPDLRSMSINCPNKYWFNTGSGLSCRSCQRCVTAAISLSCREDYFFFFIFSCCSPGQCASKPSDIITNRDMTNTEDTVSCTAVNE